MAFEHMTSDAFDKHGHDFLALGVEHVLERFVHAHQQAVLSLPAVGCCACRCLRPQNAHQNPSNPHVVSIMHYLTMIRLPFDGNSNGTTSHVVSA